MKVYIPFNSNDYNSIFSTLTISPHSFYPARGYSFRRSTQSLLNPFEDFLIGFENPVFHQKDYDYQEGYPILLETEIEKNDLVELSTNISLKTRIFAIAKTVFLFSDFKLLFRSNIERSEVESKTLKSIETKFSTLAKENSYLGKENAEFVLNSIDLRDFKAPNISVFEYFKCERIYNKIAGAIVGYVLGRKNELNPELTRLKNLSRELNNTTSLLINNIGEKDFNTIREKLVTYLNKIELEFSNNENLETSLILSSNSEVNTEFISRLKIAKIKDQSIFNLMVEGLIQSKHEELPLQLRIERCRRVINSKLNTKYPDNYIKKITKEINKIKLSISKLLGDNIKENWIDLSKILQYEKGRFNLPSGFSSNSSDFKYYNSILTYFIELDDIYSQDDLFRDRKEIVANLGQYLKEKHPEFAKGFKPRDYLMNLYSSFSNLTAKFDIRALDSTLFQSLAVLFTSGRDFNKFQNAIESQEIESTAIPMSIWGAVYGFASLPKTYTDNFFNNTEECIRLISVLRASKNESFQHYKNEGGQYFPTSKLKSSKKELEVPEVSMGNQSNQSDGAPLYDFVDLAVSKAPNSVDKDGLRDVLMNILSDQAENRLFYEPQNKLSDFKAEIHSKRNKVKGVGPKGKEDLVQLYENYLLRLNTSIRNV